MVERNWQAVCDSSVAIRLIIGWGLGCLAAASIHLFCQDTLFVPMIRKRWTALPPQVTFDAGFDKYKLELQSVCVVLAAGLCVWSIGAVSRYLRAWWAGVVSLTTIVSLLLMVKFLTARTANTYRCP